MEYLLENEFLQAVVASQGAELVSVREKATGRELMWRGDAAVWGRHAPILFPYCGRLRGGSFTHRGVRYEGGQHGFARDMEHALVEKGEAHVSLCLEANVLTMEKFPFAFRLSSTYTLQGTSVVHRVQVENQSGEVMPFSLGYHPGFACPFDAAHGTQDYVLRFDAPQTPAVVEVDEATGLVTGGTHTLFENGTDIPLTDHLFDHDSICMTNLTARSLSLVEAGTGRGVSVDITGFPYVLVWSVKGPVQFVCIEPWHGLPDAANATGEWLEKPATVRLAPDESWGTQLCMTFHL